MNNQVIFGNFLCHDYLDLDNRAIGDYCLELSNVTLGVCISNEGGWHSDYLDLDNLNPVLIPLFEEIYSRCKQLQINLGLKDELDHKIDSAWINVNKHGNFNRTHKHTGSTFSGIYYVKIPKNSGNIEFTNPLLDLPHVIQDYMIKEHNFFNSMTWEVTPEPGKLMIWPSWLLHYVKPNLSNDTRISIAFNTTVS